MSHGTTDMARRLAAVHEATTAHRQEAHDAARAALVAREAERRAAEDEAPQNAPGEPVGGATS